MCAAHKPVTLTDFVVGGGFGLNFYFHRIFQMGFGHILNFTRHGSGEQRHLTGTRGVFQNPVHIVDKTHAQHFVGFIQHHSADIGQLQRATTQVIHYPARSTDNPLRAALEVTQL